MKNFIVFTLVAIVSVIASDPGFAGRTRISTEHSKNIYSVQDIEKEIEFGREMAAIILADLKMMDLEKLNRYVNLVGNVVLQHSTRQDIEFHFAVIESSHVNAYAAPGGYIFVTRAALNLMQSEAELAGVLAHEIAHVSQRHIVKALKIRAEDDSLTSSVGRIVGSSGNSANIVFDQAVNRAVELLFSKGLQRSDEFAADENGIMLTALSGYDPGAYYQYLERIRPLVEKHGSELHKTHPPMTQRLNKLKKIITKEGLNKLNGFLNTARFEDNIRTFQEASR